MDEVVRILVSHDAVSGSGADSSQTLEVLAAEFPMLRVTTIHPKDVGDEINGRWPGCFPLPEDKMRRPWPEKLPRDATSPSEENIDRKRAATRLETFFIRIACSGSIGENQVPDEAVERVERKQIEAEPRLWRMAEELPPGWDVRTTEEGRLYFVDHNTKTATWTKP